MTSILITGPSRSGKSQFAEQLAIQSQRSVTYIATAQTDPSDPEWALRLEQHRQRRPPSWKTLETSVDLGRAIETCPDCCLVDSLGTWVASHLMRSSTDWQDEVDQLLQSLQSNHLSEKLVLLVAEEVGWGVVPAYASGRQFRDRLGELCQGVGAITDHLYLVVAGYALNLKQLGHPIESDSYLEKY